MGHFPKMGIVAVTIGEVRSIKSCLFSTLSHIVDQLVINYKLIHNISYTVMELMTFFA
jgi:hypothetical protein